MSLEQAAKDQHVRVAALPRGSQAVCTHARLALVTLGPTDTGFKPVKAGQQVHPAFSARRVCAAPSYCLTTASQLLLGQQSPSESQLPLSQRQGLSPILSPGQAAHMVTRG